MCVWNSLDVHCVDIYNIIIYTKMCVWDTTDVHCADIYNIIID